MTRAENEFLKQFLGVGAGNNEEFLKGYLAGWRRCGEFDLGMATYPDISKSSIAKEIRNLDE